jgi:putative salt-induced outer membrane protein
MIRKIAAALPLALLALPANADWQGKGELGGVLARGNTETETLNAKVDMTKETEQWKHLVGFSILRNTTDEVTSADRWELRGESDYKLTERSYIFGALRYEDDEFTDYEYQATASAGYGYKFIDTERTKLDGKIGVGYRQSELRLTGEKEDDAILRGAVDFSHQLTETTRVFDKFLVEAGSDNTFLQNVLGIEVKMTDALALGLSYEVRHNTDVLPGTEKTDQVLTANLVFGF